MRVSVTCLFVFLLLSSCATIFNTATTNFTIHSNQPCQLIINNDTISYLGKKHSILAKRSKNPFCVTLFNEKREKTVCITPRMSGTYWLNFLSPYFTGFLIDLSNPNRLTYPANVLIDMNNDQSNYDTYLPWDSLYPKKNYILKVTPLKSLAVNNPAIEMSLEKKFHDKFSSQIMASYLLPISVWDFDDNFYPDIKGFNVAFEERYYFDKSSPIGGYMGLELNYLNTRYNSIQQFTSDTDNPKNYSDSIRISKQTLSLNFKIGYQFFIQRVCIDLYAGLGIRYKNVKHFERAHPNDKMKIPVFPNDRYFSDLDGKYYTISIPLNLKIGIVF